MRIGVVSDTHGNLRHTRAAVERLKTLDVEEVLHCGDVGGAGVIELLAAWPVHFVAGNVDYSRHDELELAARMGGKMWHGRFAELELAGVLIAVIHGDDEHRLQETIESSRYRLVCCGHTHVAAQERIGETMVLNPGAVYRARPHTIAVVELPAIEATIVPLQIDPPSTARAV